MKQTHSHTLHKPAQSLLLTRMCDSVFCSKDSQSFPGCDVKCHNAGAVQPGLGSFQAWLSGSPESN